MPCALVNESGGLDHGQHTSRFFCDVEIACIETQFRHIWCFIWIAHAGELLEHSGARFGVQALAVALFADFDRLRYVHFKYFPTGSIIVRRFRQRNSAEPFPEGASMGTVTLLDEEPRRGISRVQTLRV